MISDTSLNANVLLVNGEGNLGIPIDCILNFRDDVEVISPWRPILEFVEDFVDRRKVVGTNLGETRLQCFESFARNMMRRNASPSSVRCSKQYEIHNIVGAELMTGQSEIDT
jgi:hypothetical protein